ncbi:hypothetical protein V6N11_037615 [Hibiscus sabdariffa]|uniref:RNase H type-1 domain-containing protein n=2 Tax=Hibiscus sabdariffa TaxID=183260 RepID=A0ABR2BNC8_9ROSI
MKLRITRAIQWSSPSPLYVKINFDSSFKQDDFSAVSCVVIRNVEGIILGAWCKFCSHVASAFEAEAQAEAQATLVGLQLTIDLDFQHVILEGDLTIISKLISKKNGRFIGG